MADRLLEGPQDDGGAELLVAVERVVDLLDGRDHAEQGGAAAGDDPLLGRGAGGVEGVLDAGLGLLHRGLGRRADADQGHAAGELGQPLLELLLVVLALGLLDLAAELVDPLLDVRPLAGPLDHRRAVLVDLDLLGPAELARAGGSPASGRGPR